jgi:DNA-binding SARP family transcriptional activator/predicted ATPase
MLEFRILGPLEVVADGRVLELPAAKPRGLLAILLLNANAVVAADRLIDELWGEEPPPSAAKLLQGYVSRLRTLLPGELILTRPRGYQLRLEPEQLDLGRFERLLAESRTASPAGAVAALREALALWRGPPLADVRDAPFAQTAAPPLEELQLAALERCMDAELELGRHAEVVGELRELVAEHPYRERLTGQLMVALYRSGRQADALAAYRDTRARLVDDLGLEPGEALRELEQQVLAQAPELQAAQPAPEAAVEREPEPEPEPELVARRRLVTVVRAGLADPAGLAERLDPEALHAVLDRCWDDAATVVERHGGAVERSAADGLMGVFGRDELHEDDALRALRAALELRDAVEPELGIGVDTGQVFVGTAARGGRFATGAPVEGAAGLERAAAAGEILVGESTHALAGGAVLVEPADGGWRLLGLREAAAAIDAAAFVGRAEELESLERTFADAVAGPGCRLVTVIGPPGIGKSRLVRELGARLGDRATVVLGRCPSYGEGITYGPLAEMVRGLGAQRPTDLVGDDAARLVLGAAGDGEAPGRPEETAWAFRRLFEALARHRPLVAVFEDVHWAEPTLLDLVDHIAAFSAGAPILLVCLARPELAETRPAWVAPQAHRSVLALDALPVADARALAAELGAGETAARVAAAAEGNPLFVEQLVAVGDDSLPPTIHAVLTARIDRLGAGERAALELASVEGRSFHRGALAELLPERLRAGLDAHLIALVRGQLIRADVAALAGDDAFRFAHALIREAAYEGLPKHLRADLHERVGRWLAARDAAPDELIGFHLEQTCRYRAEFGVDGDAGRALAAEAAQRLATAARAALVRADLPTSARLLERAVALLSADDAARAALLPALGVALLDAGRLDGAERVLGEALAVAEERADARLAARARVELQFLRLHAAPAGGTPEATAVATEAARVLAEHDDEIGQCRAWRLLAWVAWIKSQAARADAAWERAAALAARAGDERELFEILGWRAAAAVFGPTPVDEAIRRCEAICEQVAASPIAAADALRPLGLLHALRGDFDEARRLIRASNETLDELGRMQSVVSHHEAVVELLAGEPAAAERRLRQGYERLEAMGEQALLATTAAFLAQAVQARGDADEAEALCATAERLAPADDVITHAIARGVRARVLAGRGRYDEAESAGAEAVALAARTDALVEHGDAHLALADVLELRGRGEAAAGHVREAISLYERKGAVVLAERARSRRQPEHTTSGRS